MIALCMLHFAGIWMVVSAGDLDLCRKSNGNFSMRISSETSKSLRLQDDACVSDLNLLLLKIRRVDCAAKSTLFIKELPIEKDLCKHQTGRCFLFNKASAEAGLIAGLPLNGCKHLHWMHAMNKITVRLELKTPYNTGMKTNKGVDFSYYFTQQNVQESTEDVKSKTLRMDILVLGLVVLVVILSVATVISFARMCYLKRNGKELDKSPTAYTTSEREILAADMSNVSNGPLLQPVLENNEREVISNRLYAEGRHLYEDARF